MASHPDTVRVWDVKSEKTILEINTTGLSVVEAIYPPDMTMIATGGKFSKKDILIKIWDANTGKLVVNLKGHMGDVSCLTGPGLEATRSYLVQRTAPIGTWNTATWHQITVLTGYTNNISSIAPSPNNRVLASASWDNTARLWYLDNGQPIG